MPDSTALVSQLVQGLDPGALVTKYVVVAEVVGMEDGERGVWIDRGDCTDWEFLGLLNYALTFEDDTED